MYIQITTKCNISCKHCCYSCGPKKGEHMSRSTWVDAIVFARDCMGDETIAIGGGEPTLHPEFFDVLEFSLESFSYVWLATNGTKTRAMNRLYKIIHQEDYRIYQEDKLTVALSTDYYHRRDLINSDVWYKWTMGAKRRNSGFELRDVTNEIVGVGRAKKTGVYRFELSKKNCVCSDLFITPQGNIKPCGCPDSPVIGNVRDGILPAWERLLRASEDYNNYRCFQGINLKEKNR